MCYAEKVVDLFAKALSKEEAELADLASTCSKPSLRSVCQFAEGWIKPLVAKEAMRRGGPVFRFEKNRVDITIYDENRVRALVEVKGPLEVTRHFHPVIFERVIGDFRKQGERLKAGLECIVILLLHGTRENVEGWVRQSVLPAVGRQVPTLHLIRLPSDPIPLNGPNITPRVLSVVAFRVDTAS